jgi:hypothetical protein
VLKHLSGNHDVKGPAGEGKRVLIGHEAVDRSPIPCVRSRSSTLNTAVVEIDCRPLDIGK